jgi:hypothetical protein
VRSRDLLPEPPGLSPSVHPCASRSSSGIRTGVAVFNDGHVLVPFSSYAGTDSGIPTVKAIADVLPLTVRVDRAALVDTATRRTWRLPHIS